MRFLKRFVDAFRGAVLTFAREVNARIQLAVAVAVVATGLFVRLTSGEWIAVSLCIGFVLTAETFNTAIERLCDRITTDKDNAIRDIKDLAAGAVLLSALTSLAVAAVIAWRVWERCM